MTAFSLTETSALDTSFYGKESLYRDCIAQVMRDDGWSVQTEVRTDLGIADLVARRNGETWVIEAKVYGDNNSVAHACGQLLFYTDELQFTKRLIAIPERLKFKFDRVLSYHGIDLFWFTPYSHTVNALFEKESKKFRQHDCIERSMISMQELIEFIKNAELAANLEGFVPLNDPKTDQLWEALADMLQNGALAINFFRGVATPTLTLSGAA